MNDYFQTQKIVGISFLFSWRDLKNYCNILTEKTKDSELEKKLQDMEAAHKVLESRFNRSMKEVAELSDEKQQLEHVVQQLQLETESIGLYSPFYFAIDTSWFLGSVFSNIFWPQTHIQ